MTTKADVTPTRQRRVAFVTGPSGAGRSTAIGALEDAQWETIDNIPLGLVPALLKNTPADSAPLALGIDVRNRDFSVDRLLQLIADTDRRADVDFSMLYLDCAQDVLLRRYSETRRRHPMAPEEDAAQGIERELELLIPIRDAAEILIDTSALTIHDLRAAIREWVVPNPSAQGALSVVVHSFSYKRGLPMGLDMVFDVRFLKNPYWDAALRPKTGRDPAVQEHVRSDPRFDAFFTKVLGMTEFLLPAYSDEGKSHLSIGFGCTGGRHRSVTLAETLAQALVQKGARVSIRHHEMQRGRG